MSLACAIVAGNLFIQGIDEGRFDMGLVALNVENYTFRKIPGGEYLDLRDYLSSTITYSFFLPEMADLTTVEILEECESMALAAPADTE